MEMRQCNGGRGREGEVPFQGVQGRPQRVLSVGTEVDVMGLISVRSRYAVRETIDRLAAAVESAGLIVFGRIDHGAYAAEVGMPLRPTELLLFGHPRGGTPLMQEQQTAGIDLPLKALAWEDEAGQIWLTYNDTEWLAQRHGLGSRSAGSLEAIRTSTAALAAEAGGGDLKRSARPADRT
jgi:uncharacterized protein (DUF302 family)